MTRLKSMDVTIGDVTRSYDFGAGIEVSSDDEGEASLELLRDASTTEVVLSKGIASARVEVSYEYRVTGSVTVDLEDLDGYADSEELVSDIENGGFDDIFEAVANDVQDNASYEYIAIDAVDVEELFDEDGESIDE